MIQPLVKSVRICFGQVFPLLADDILPARDEVRRRDFITLFSINTVFVRHQVPEGKGKHMIDMDISPDFQRVSGQKTGDRLVATY